MEEKNKNTLEKTTREEKKKVALEYMKQLDIYKPYLKEFEEKDIVCYFENFAGFWAYQEKELIEKIKEIEKKYNCVVYAITHEFAEFGELYDFLIVSDYKEDWENSVSEVTENHHFVLAYVWNKDDDSLSEMGSILVSSFGGGIRRVG